VLAQPLDVRDQVGCRVAAEVDTGLAGVRGAAAAVALVEQDDTVGTRIEKAPQVR
jgi:hypothetical protein